MAMTLIEIAKEMRAWAIARDDIPRLLAEVDRLRDLLRRADEVIQNLVEEERYSF